jgi:hypothetical protein
MRPFVRAITSRLRSLRMSPVPARGLLYRGLASASQPAAAAAHPVASIESDSVPCYSKTTTASTSQPMQNSSDVRVANKEIKKKGSKKEVITKPVVPAEDKSVPQGPAVAFTERIFLVDNMDKAKQVSLHRFIPFASVVDRFIDL